MAIAAAFKPSEHFASEAVAYCSTANSIVSTAAAATAYSD